MRLRNQKRVDCTCWLLRLWSILALRKRKPLGLRWIRAPPPLPTRSTCSGFQKNPSLEQGQCRRKGPLESFPTPSCGGEVELQFHPTRRDAGLPRNTRTEDPWWWHRHSDGAVAVSRMDDQTLVGWWISQVVSDYFSDISTLLVKSLLWTECTLKSHPPLWCPLEMELWGGN